MSAPTYGDLIRAGAGTLQQADLHAPVMEARRLLQLVSGFEPATLIAKEQDLALLEHSEAYFAVIQLRAARQPFSHIAGWTDFYGLRLRTDGRALIPRPDSEIVIDLALDQIPRAATWEIADLGTGSGALLASLLHHRPSANGIAVEVDSLALSLARENFESLDLTERVQVFPGSWSDWTDWDSVDLVVSNPPYICSNVLPTLAPEVRDHDPVRALDGGSDGLAAYRDIIVQAGQRMRSGSHLVLEIGFDQKSSVSALLYTAGFSNLQHKQDLGGHDRAIAAIKT